MHVYSAPVRSTRPFSRQWWRKDASESKPLSTIFIPLGGSRVHSEAATAPPVAAPLWRRQSVSSFASSTSRIDAYEPGVQPPKSSRG